VLVGGLETLNLIGDETGADRGGGFWGAIGAINDNSACSATSFIGVFAVAWIGLGRVPTK